MVDFALNPQRTALINVDMQRCFIEDSPIAAPQGKAVLERINRLADACREAGILVVHTAHVYRQDGSNWGVAAELNPVVRTGIVTQGAPTAALHPELVVGPQDIRLEKCRYGAFQSTDLELILRSRGIDSVIVSGLVTNVCCDTTAREAMQRDFRVFFLSDGTGTVPFDDIPAETMQKVALATMARIVGQVISVADMMAKIRGAQRAAA